MIKGAKSKSVMLKDVLLGETITFNETFQAGKTLTIHEQVTRITLMSAVYDPSTSTQFFDNLYHSWCVDDDGALHYVHLFETQMVNVVSL